MERLYTYRIFPSKKQQEELCKIFGCHRYIFNKSLEYKLSHYIKNEKLTCTDVQKWVTLLRKEKTWLQECPSQVLQMSVRQMENACTKFTKGKPFPKFLIKSNKQSVRFPQAVKIKFKKLLIQLPKIGDISCVYDRKFAGDIKMVTVTLSVTGKYFVKIMTGYKDISFSRRICPERSIGIGKGINTLYSLSNGQRISKPLWITDTEQRLKREYKSLSRKVKNSKKWSNQCQKIHDQEEHLDNQKRDYLQKVTTKIIKEFDTIIIEDNQSIFQSMLKYKSEWYGNNFIEVGNCKKCSDVCSECGTIAAFSEGVTWKCLCGYVHNRNHNAAINIKKIGLRNQPISANTE